MKLESVSIRYAKSYHIGNKLLVHHHWQQKLMLPRVDASAQGAPNDANPDQQQMTPYARFEQALKGLLTALDQLEVACERRQKADAERLNIEEELAVLQDDRTRLALELDDAQARAKSLELANGEVARRLHKASASIKALLTAITPEN